MASEIILNRESLSSVRSKINKSINQENTNTTNIATNTANIATNTANIATNVINIATNTAGILTKQNKEALSTLNYGYRAVPSNYTLATADGNTVFHVTNSGASNFTVPATAGLASFRAGVVFIVANSKDSTNDVTMVEGGSTIEAASFTIVPGASATFMMISTDNFLQIS